MDRLANMTTFVRVVECSGFSAAARRLHISPAMVTQHVHALEERLGVRLLNRTTRRISLTEVGKSYYERCLDILAEIEEADQIATALQTSPRGTLQVNVSPLIARSIAPVVAKYLTMYPDAAIDMTGTERMVNLVEEGFDLAVRMTPTPDSSLIVRKLASWRHVLCCSRDYITRIGMPKEIAELSKHNCLRYTFYPFGDAWHFNAPDGTRDREVHVSGSLRTTSLEALRLAAIAGCGVLLAPGYSISEDLREGRLVAILPEFVPVEFAINAIYPHRRHMPAKVRCFIDLLKRHFLDGGVWKRIET
ncbi:MAG TPA: LysR family transcriptional regulator [Blastocatellia bacterium]|nr:LysR family transcriptional regulator [Blastocatellia bacterium]